MLFRSILILKLLSVDRLSSRSISSSKVTPLAHELLNDSVETAALVVQWLAGHWGITLFAGAESAKVLRRLWDNVVVELKDDTAGWLIVERDVKEHLWTRSIGRSRHVEVLVWLSWVCEWYCGREKLALVTPMD